VDDKLLIEDVRDATDLFNDSLLLCVVVDKVSGDCNRQLATELLLLKPCSNTTTTSSSSDRWRKGGP